MQTVETFKAKSQETLNNLLEKGKEQPEEVRTWGVTAGGAVVGAIALAAVAKGVLAILATLASPPVALTIGAVGGGVFGWNFMKSQNTPSNATPEAQPETIAAEVMVAEGSPILADSTAAI